MNPGVGINHQSSCQVLVSGLEKLLFRLRRKAETRAARQREKAKVDSIIQVLLTPGDISTRPNNGPPQSLGFMTLVATFQSHRLCLSQP